MGRPRKSEDDLQHGKLWVKVTPAFKDEISSYACKLGRGVSSLIRDLLEHELEFKTLLLGGSHLSTGQIARDISSSIDEEQIDQAPGVAQSTDGHYTIETREYGRVAVFEHEAKGLRFGVTIYPFRSSAVMLVVDLAVKGGEFGRLNLAKGIAPALDEAIDLGSYSWDTPRYRDLAVRLGLDPDYKRPKFRPDHKNLADKILADIDKDNDSDWDVLSRKNYLYDFLDLVRMDIAPTTALYERVCRDAVDFQEDIFTDEIAAALEEIGTRALPQEPLTPFYVHFLPSAFGRGFYATLLSREGGECHSDGWHKTLYSGLGGIALDFETNTQWRRTVRNRLLEQGTILLSRQVAEIYMQHEGAFWVWAHGGTMFNEIEAREPTRWEALKWRVRPPSTPVSDAAVVNFKVSKMRAAST